MTVARQRGILLLPVALTLAIVGALAYTMTREGSMGVSAVDAEYDTDVARYLAEAGANLAKWQNEKRGCLSSVGFNTVNLPGGSIAAGNSDIILTSKGVLTANVTATSTRGAVNRLSRAWDLHNLGSRSSVTIGSSGSSDTFIREGSTAQNGSTGLELTDGKAHALLKFAPSSIPKNGLIVKAELKLYQWDTKSTQPTRTLAVHRVTRDWSTGKATWTSPWDMAGGDYAPAPAAVSAIDGIGTYNWRVDALVDGWASQALPNFGVLLKPGGLLEARFYSFESDINDKRPQLVIDYYPSCR
jgi:hypothetical protein